MEHISGILKRMNLSVLSVDVGALGISDLLDDIFFMEVKGGKLVFWVSSPLIKMEIERRWKDILSNLNKDNVNDLAVFIGRKDGKGKV